VTALDLGDNLGVLKPKSFRPKQQEQGDCVISAVGSILVALAGSF
jgi:hypothetical protein